MSRTLEDLARAVGGRVEGRGDVAIEAIRPLDGATGSDLTFLAHPRYRAAAERSAAAAILVPEGQRLPGKNLLVVDNPYLALARLMGLLAAGGEAAPVRREAHLGADARLGRDVSLGAGVVIGDRSRIGERTRIGAGTVIGDEVVIGTEARLHANVTIYPGCRLGDRVAIHGGAVIGSDGFGYAVDQGVYHKIPQLGDVVIEDDVEIGANTTVDRATFGTTRIGRGTKIDNLVQVGHNCRIGAHCAVVAQVGLSGSVTVGDGVEFGGQAGSVGHLTIGAGARIGARAVVTGDVAPGAYVMGHPAIDHRIWKRAQAAWRRLPDLLRRTRRLEAGGRPAERED